MEKQELKPVGGVGGFLSSGSCENEPSAEQDKKKVFR